MKSLFSFLLMMITTLSYSQNVGIGTNTPTERLDINGNINITGTLKASGISGSSGQVLTSTGSGLAWSSLGSSAGYKKCVMLVAGIGNWTVPTGVTEVMVELWGGGSGGTNNCGGTSGGYARTVQTVSPGTSLAYSVGGFGGGGVSTSFEASNSVMTFPTGTVTAYGGLGILAADKRGAALSGTTTLPDKNVFFMTGNMGETTKSTFGMRNSSTYVEYVTCGHGGAPVGMFNSTPIAGDVIRYENGSQVLKVSGGAYNVLPGSGGAAGYPTGSIGGSGLIIIWYN